MQLGAFFAGSAIENSMLGAAHALANPLTAHFGTVHGRAVGVPVDHPRDAVRRKGLPDRVLVDIHYFHRRIVLVRRAGIPGLAGGDYRFRVSIPTDGAPMEVVTGTFRVD